MKNFLIFAVSFALFLPAVVLATPVSWDFASSVLQPLKSMWGAEVKVDRLTATSTTASSSITWGLSARTFFASSTVASSTFSNGLNLLNGCLAYNGTCISLSGGSGGNSKWATSTASSSAIHTNSAYAVGIGSSTPYAKLSVTNEGSHPSFVVEDATSPDSSPFIIDAAGNVGIGVAPSSKLDVSGDFELNGVLAFNGGYIQLDGSNDDALLYNGLNNLVESRSSTGFRFLVGGITDASEKMRLTATGLGIGTTSPYSMLSVAGTTTAMQFEATSTSATSTFNGGLLVGLGFRLSNLPSCNTIDTDANGFLICGTDATGGAGTGSNWQFVSATAIAPTTTVGTIVSASSTFTSSLTAGSTTLEQLKVSTTTGTSTFNGAVQIGTTAGANVFKVTPISGLDISGSESVGGMANFNVNTTDEIAGVFHSNHTGTSRTLSVVCNNASYGGNCFHVRSAGTVSAVNILGAPTGQGLIKAASDGAGDADASILSLDASTGSFLGQLIFGKCGTATKCWNMRDSGNTERMTYLGSGFLGIGTTSPYSMLSVAGTTTAQQFEATSTTATSTLNGGLYVGKGFRLANLPGCDSIDSDANGFLICGTDASGGGGGTDVNWTWNVTGQYLRGATSTGQGLIVGSTTVTNINSTSTSATNTSQGPSQWTANADYGGNNPGEGVIGVNMGSFSGSAISIHSTSAAAAGDGELVHIEVTNPNHANELLKIESASTQGGAEDIYVVSPVPDMVFCDNTDSANDCVEYEVDNHGTLVFNSRNSGDTAFERNVQIAAARLGGMVCLGSAFDCPFLSSKLTIVGTSTFDYLNINRVGVTAGVGEVFTVDANTNVGVGTTTPWGSLSVVGTSTRPALVVASSTGSSIFRIGGLSNTILELFANTGTKLISAVAETVTLLGTWDFSGATVKVHTYPAFTYATSTAWTGTTTIPLGPAYTAESWSGVKCYTDTGTLWLAFHDGTNDMNYLQASTTVGSVTLSSNNTFTASEKRYVEIGNPASSPTKISCSVDKIVNN